MHFKSVAPATVAKSFKDSAKDTLGGESISEIRQAIARDLEPHRKAYEGGMEAAKYFLQKKDSEKRGFQDRLNRVYNVRVVRPIAEIKAALSYGEGPERLIWHENRPERKVEQAYKWLEAYRESDGEEPAEPIMEADEATEQLQAAYTKIFQDSNHELIFPRGIQQRIVDGVAWAKVFPRYGWSPSEEAYVISGIGINFAPRREDIIAIPDPDDAGSTLGYVECRSTELRLWTMGHIHEGAMVAGYVVVDDDLTIKSAPVLNYTHALPLIPLGDGRSLIKDATYYQRHLINLKNIDYILRLRQGFAIPVIKGDTRNKKDANGNIVISEQDALQLELNADFAYANPNADLAEHRMGSNEAYGDAMRQHNMPSDYYRDTTSAEKPLAKKLSWTSTLIDVGTLQTELVSFEDKLKDSIVSYLAQPDVALAYELGEFDPDMVEGSTQYIDNPLPTDQRENERADREAVTADLMLTVEYIMRNSSKDLTPQQIGYRAYLLDKERKDKSAMTSNMNFGGFDPFANIESIDGGIIDA